MIVANTSRSVRYGPGAAGGVDRPGVANSAGARGGDRDAQVVARHALLDRDGAGQVRQDSAERTTRGLARPPCGRDALLIVSYPDIRPEQVRRDDEIWNAAKSAVWQSLSPSASMRVAIAIC